MDLYWTCSDCGSSNPYPSAKMCECCGKEISKSEAEAAKETVTRIEKQKKEAEDKRKREEAQRIAAERRAREEAERQRRLEEKRREEKRRKEEIARKRQGAAEKSKKRLDAWLNIVEKTAYYGTAKTVGVLCFLCVIVCGVLVGISVINNNVLGTKLSILQANAEAAVTNFYDMQYETYTYPSEELFTDEEYVEEVSGEETNEDEFGGEENAETEEQESFDENETSVEEETDDEYFYAFKPLLKIDNVIEKAANDLRESEGIQKLKEFLRW